MKPFLILGAGGLLAWYLYSQGYFASLFGGGTVVPPATGGTVPPATGTGTTPPASNPNSLAAVYARMVTDAGSQAANTGLSAWGWNYSLARVSTVAPPDPSAIWPSGLDPSQNMTAAQYWAVVAPYLTSTYGMSGVRGMGSMKRLGWAV